MTPRLRYRASLLFLCGLLGLIGVYRGAGLVQEQHGLRLSALAQARTAPETPITFEPSTHAARIDDLLTTPSARGAHWGVFALDVATGETVYAFNGDQLFQPASVNKLISTATALDRLGGRFQFSTTLSLQGWRKDSLFVGSIRISGDGDPSFGSMYDRRRDPFEQWISALRNEGISHIEASIVREERGNFAQRYPEGWDHALIRRHGFAPAQSGLVYHDNLVSISISTPSVDQPGRFEQWPANYLKIANQTLVKAAWRGPPIDVLRATVQDSVYFAGTLRSGYRGSIRLPVYDPPALFEAALLNRLQLRGLTYSRAAHSLAPDESFEPYEQHYEIESAPLGELIKEVNKRSNNLYAEQIYRRIGNGDLRTAERQTMRFLNEEGINARYFVFADGSGLSRRNLVSPEGLARLLAVMTQHEEATPFRASLAHSGERGSTLRYRLTDLNTNGKTGSMERVRSLAGYVETTSGRELAFVVFANNYPRSSAAITSITDQIIRELASL